MFYLIRLIVPPVTKLQSTFFFFPLLRKLDFTGTRALLCGIQRLSDSNGTFNHEPIRDSESAQKLSQMKCISS